MNVEKILAIERKDLMNKYESLIQLNRRMGRRKFVKKYERLLEELKQQTAKQKI